MRTAEITAEPSEVVAGLLACGTTVAVRGGQLVVRALPATPSIPRELGRAANKLKLAIVAELAVACSGCGASSYVEYGLNYVLSGCSACGSARLAAKNPDRPMGYWTANVRKANDFCGECQVITETLAGKCLVCWEKDEEQFEMPEVLR